MANQPIKRKLSLKRLQFAKRSTSGRNSFGHLTSFRKGGGSKHVHVNIDFKRSLFRIPAKICFTMFDSNRSAFISLILYQNGYLSFILTPNGLKPGDVIMSNNDRFLYHVGDSIPLKYIQIGSLVHNVPFTRNGTAKIARSAGTFSKIVRQTNMYTYLRLRSGEIRMIRSDVNAVVGVLSNEFQKLKKYYKAGTLRRLGRRPTVRGIAMNPVDHPNGGRTKGGGPFTDRWGNLAKGGRCRCVKRNRFIIKPRFK